MKREDMEKYMASLSPALQEKARACKNMDELKKLIAENDVELPEDILEAVSGGCSVSDKHEKGYIMQGYFCTECHCVLKYWDDIYWAPETASRMYCDNPNCIACKGNWLFADVPVYEGIKNKGHEFKRVK